MAQVTYQNHVSVDIFAFDTKVKIREFLLYLMNNLMLLCDYIIHSVESELKKRHLLSESLLSSIDGRTCGGELRLLFH